MLYPLMEYLLYWIGLDGFGTSLVACLISFTVLVPIALCYCWSYFIACIAFWLLLSGIGLFVLVVMTYDE